MLVSQQYHTLVIPHAARLVEALHKLLSSLATQLFKAPLHGLATARQRNSCGVNENPMIDEE